MKSNMGTLDRLIRFAVAIAIIVLYIAKVITGTTAVALLILAGVFILTSVISFCPLYLPLGISTSKKKKE